MDEEWIVEMSLCLTAVEVVGIYFELEGVRAVVTELSQSVTSKNELSWVSVQKSFSQMPQRKSFKAPQISLSNCNDIFLHF